MNEIDLIPNAKALKFVRFTSPQEMRSVMVHKDSPYSISYKLDRESTAPGKTYLFCFSINRSAYKDQYRVLQRWFATNLDTMSLRTNEKIALLMCDVPNLERQYMIPASNPGISDSATQEEKWFDEAWDWPSSSFIVHSNESSNFTFCRSVVPKRLLFVTPPLPPIEVDRLRDKNFLERKELMSELTLLKTKLTDLKNVLRPLYLKGEI